MTNKTFEQISVLHKCWQWPVCGFYGWETKCYVLLPLFSRLALFISSQLSFCTVFYDSPSLCLYGAIGKYTTSRLIISQLVERSHFFCVVLAAASKKTPPTPLEHSHLFGRHTWVKLSNVTALRCITCLALVLEVPDSSCGGVLGLCVRGEWGVWGQLLGLWHLHHIASIRIPFKWQNEWNSRTL